MISAIVLWAFFVINLLLFLYAFIQVKNSGKTIKFLISWGFEDGIFVWEDAVIISIYNILTTLIAIILQDLRWAITAYLIFWIIRGLGETIYYFLQQFFPVKQYPHNQVLRITFWKKLFGNVSEQKYYILSQVTVEMVTSLSLLFLIMVLHFWEALAPFRWI